MLKVKFKGEVQAYTIITLKDSSKGIMSFRGYQDYLLKLTAREIVKVTGKGHEN